VQKTAPAHVFESRFLTKAHSEHEKLGVSLSYIPSEDTPMKLVRPLLLPVALILLPVSAASAQTESAPQTPACTWNCYSVVLPYGLHIREVTDGGSFVTLEDGSVWEIRLPQRPVASSWQAGDFVQLKTIASPIDRFEILLAHGDYDRAEAKLVGRRSVNQE
jgi:hypothetical protein